LGIQRIRFISAHAQSWWVFKAGCGFPVLILVLAFCLIIKPGALADTSRQPEKSSQYQLYAQETDDSEESWDYDADWDLESDFSVADDSPNFTWAIDVAFENYFNTNRELHFQDAYEKQEISARLDVEYGTSDRYLKSVTDLYFFPTFINEDIGDDYPYSPESRTHRNLRISSESSEIQFRELYFNWLFEKYRLRIGNQVYPWGTADFLNSTSYLNPRDLRELILKDEEEIRLGVPSVSAMLFLPKFTAELVFVPVHTAAAIPSTNHFWAVKQVEGQYPVYFDDSDPMDATSENFGYAARISKTWRGMDFSVSGYHGPDNDQLLVPFRTVLEPNKSVGVMIQPQYFVVDYVGADFSMTYEDFAFNAEAAYSPNKRGVIEQDTDRPQDLEFPFDTERADYISYSLGVNYFIPMQDLLPGHAGDSLFTMEWYQATYFDDKFEAPQITNMLSFQFQDSYFDKRVKVWLAAVFETRQGGMVFWPKLGYDFKNGFEAEIGYVGINGSGEGDYDEDSLFYYYRDNDLIMVNFTYAFP